MSECWTPAAGAASVAKHVIEAPTPSDVVGHTMSDAARSESVTTTGSSGTLPELVTSKVTRSVPGVATASPGAVLASSSSIFLTTVIAGNAPK